MITQTSINNKIQDFKNLSNSKKIIIISSISLIVITLVTAFTYLQKPNYDVLFSQLRGSDPATVTGKLSELKIKYEVQEEKDGTITILVPEDDKARARVDISASFSPTDGTVGYEALDKISFGETEKDREQKRKIALEGEIVRTLEMLPSVKWARVHLTIPEKNILKINESDVEHASASVTLSLDESQAISKNQIKGTAKMISNAVPGLNPENVEIIDENMNSLSEGLFGEGALGLSGSIDNTKLKQSQEKDLAAKAKRLLETIVGDGNVAVEVEAKMNFDVSEVVENKFGKSSPVSEKAIEKANTNTSNPLNTPPGSDTNADTEDYTTNSSTQNQEEHYNETITNYETEKTTSKTSKTVGEIERLTMSVAVNEDSLKDANGNLDKKLQDELIENAKTAVGFNEERDDKIQFTVVPFKSDIVKKSALDVAKDFSTPLITLIVVVLGFIVLIFTSKKAFNALSKSGTINIKSSFEDFDGSNPTSVNKSSTKNRNTNNDDDDDDFIDLAQEIDINEKRLNRIIDKDPEQVRKLLRQYKRNID